MALFDLPNIDFGRLLLQDKLTRPQMGLALFPTSEVVATSEYAFPPTVEVTATNIILTVAPTTVSIVYAGKTLQEIANEINASSLPIRAHPLSRTLRLEAGDMIVLAETEIPAEFQPYDRGVNGSVILRIGRWTVRHERLTQISLLPPYPAASTLPWYPRISVGSFSQRYEGRVYHYEVPEYEDQTWSQLYGRPFMDLSSVEAIPLGNNAFKLPRGPIFWNGGNLEMFAGDTPLTSNAIEDIDIHNKILYLRPEIRVSGPLQVSYSYLEESFEYKGVNLNAHFSQNPHLLDRYVLIYLVPSDGLGTSLKKQCVRHVVADTVAEGIDRIERENGRIPTAILGAYSIQQLLPDIRILDTRSYGGGLKSIQGPQSPEHQTSSPLNFPVPGERDVEDRIPESRDFWDIGQWDGESYPGAAAVMFDLPEHLRNDLPVSDIQRKARKFLAAGVAPVMQWSERELPDVSGPNTTDISLCRNLGLTDSYAGATGLGWITEFEIPNQSVLTDWSTTPFDPQVPVYDADDSKVLLVDTKTIYQTYLKSTPIAGVRYERRTVFSEGHAEPWKTITLFDSREVGSRQLMKGVLAFVPEMQPYQVRNIQVQAPFRTEELDLILDECADGIIHMQRAIADNSVDGYLSQFRPDVALDQQVPLANFYGLPDAYRAPFQLAAVSTEMEERAIDLLPAITGSLGDDILFKTSVNGAYASANQTEVYVSPSLETFGIALEYVAATYGTSEVQYLELWDHYETTAASIADQSNDYLTPFWTADSFGNHYPRQLRTGLSVRDVDPATSEDHLYFDVLARFSRATRWIPDWSSLGSIALLGPVFNSTVQHLLSLLPEIIDGVPQFGSNSSLAAHHWYASHDRYGEVAGTLIMDLGTYYDNVLAALDRLGTPGAPVGFDAAATVSAMHLIREILKVAVPGARLTVERGGILDARTPYLIAGLEWFLTRFAAYQTTYEIEVEEDLEDYEDTLNLLIREYARGIVTTTGQIYESGVVNQEPGPFGARLPDVFLRALANSVLRDSAEYRPLLQAVLRTTLAQGRDGHYPTDPTAAAGGGEGYLSAALSEVISLLTTEFPAIDWNRIQREA